MRPAVIVFAPLLMLPLLACESELAGPESDAAVTELQQPPSAEPLFQSGEGSGCGSGVVVECGEGFTNGPQGTEGGPHAAADAAMAEPEAGADLEGQHTKTQARTRKGDGSLSTSEESRGVEDRKQRRSKYGRG